MIVESHLEDFIPDSKGPTPSAFPSSTCSCVGLSQSLGLSEPDDDVGGGNDELWNTEVFEGMLMAERFWKESEQEVTKCGGLLPWAYGDVPPWPLTLSSVLNTLASLTSRAE